MGYQRSRRDRPQRDTLVLFDGDTDVRHVVADRMVVEKVDTPFSQTAYEAAPPVFDSLPGGQMTNLTIGVQINFLSLVTISEPGGRNASNNVVIVDPTIRFELYVINISVVADARAAVGK